MGQPGAPALQQTLTSESENFDLAFQSLLETVNVGTMHVRDAIKILGLTPTSTYNDIQRRFTELARQALSLQPDACEARMQELLSARNSAQKVIGNIVSMSIPPAPGATEQKPNMEKTKVDYLQYNAELVIESVSGKRKLDDEQPVLETFDNINDLTLRGQYMALTLRRILLNVEFKSKYGDDKQRFTVMEFLFHNVWDYPLNAFSSAKMIDTEGFQHGGESKGWEFNNAIIGGKLVPVSLDQPESPLEDHSKTRGWLWFDELPKGVMPQRVVIGVNIFEPGHTSGWVKNTEVLEFFIKSCSTKPAKLP